MAQGKLPWMKFSPKDFMYDLRFHSLSTMGAWIAILCAIWELGENGSLTTTAAELAKYAGSSKRSFDRQMTVISRSNVGQMTYEGNDVWTVTSRRMARDLAQRAKYRKYNKKRGSKTTSKTALRPPEEYYKKTLPKGGSKKSSHSPEEITKAKKVFGYMLGTWERVFERGYPRRRQDNTNVYSLLKLYSVEDIIKMIDRVVEIMRDPDPRKRYINSLTFGTVLAFGARLIAEIKNREDEEADEIWEGEDEPRD